MPFVADAISFSIPEWIQIAVAFFHTDTVKYFCGEDDALTGGTPSFGILSHTAKPRKMKTPNLTSATRNASSSVFSRPDELKWTIR
jgi:hypothetical protein